MAIYIIVRKKGTKRWTSVYQPKKGTTSSKLRSTLRKNLSKQLEFKLVNFEQLQKIIMKQRPGASRKRVKRRKVRSKSRVLRRKVRSKSRVKRRKN